MMTISVRTDLERAFAQLTSITERQQFAFATARALTQTAVDVQAEVRKNMPSRFTLRRQWIVKGIRVERATKQNLVATVYSKDEFMGRQETGGPKRPKYDQNLAIPMKAVRRTKNDLIRKADLPANLGQASFNVTRRTKNGPVTKAMKGTAGTIFKMQIRGKTYLCRRRPGKDVEIMYLLIPQAQIKERLGLSKDGMRVARNMFIVNLRESLRQAVATARG